MRFATKRKTQLLNTLLTASTLTRNRTARHTIRWLALLLVGWLAFNADAFAQATFRWISSTGTDWQVAANWTLVSGTDDGSNGFPDGNDNALFDNSSPTPNGALTNIPAWDGNFTINGFTGTVQVGADFQCGGQVTITTGTLQVNSGFDFSANALTINGGTLTLEDPGNSHYLGAFNLQSGTFNGSGAAGVVTITQSGGTFNAGNGTYTFEPVLAGPSPTTVDITVFDRTGGTFNAGTSTFIVAANTSGSGSGTRSATATLATSVATTFNNLTIRGENTSGSGGTRNRIIAFTGSGTFTISGTLTREQQLTNVTGTNLQYATGATLVYNLGANSNPFAEWPASSGPTNVTKQGTNTLTLNASRTIPLGGVLYLQAGTFTVATGNTLTVNGALRRGGGSLTVSGTLTYGTSGSQTIDGQSFTGAVVWYDNTATIGDEFPTTIPNLNISISGSGTITGTASRNVQGKLRITNGTLNLGSNTLTVLGDIAGSTASSANAVIADATTLNLGGGSTSTLAQSITGSITLNKLTIDKQNPASEPWNPNNTVTVQAAGTITFTANGNLTISNGTLSFGASSNLVATDLPTLSLNLSSNGIIRTGGQPLGQIASTSGTFTANGKIVFNGSATETFPRNRTIARIEIANPNNVQVDNTANNTVTVTDSLIFTSGRITQTDATNYLFVIGSGCVVTGSGYVDGPVRRVFPTTGNGNGVVPTGRSTGSSPGQNWIRVVSGLSGTVQFTQENSDVGLPSSGGNWFSRSLTRFWRISPAISGAYTIEVERAGSGVSSPLGRILRISNFTPLTAETSYTGTQTDNGTVINAAFNDAFSAVGFTIVRDATNTYIWGGQIDNSWGNANNWWLINNTVPSQPPQATTDVIINGNRTGNVNTVTGDAVVQVTGASQCQSLTVGDTTAGPFSTLIVQASLSVGTGYQPANTTFGSRSTVEWHDGSGGVQADEYHNLVVNTTSGLGTQGTGSITVSGNMTKQGSGTFTPASGNSITVAGNYTNTAGDADYSNASLTLSQYTGRTFTLTAGTVSGNITIAAQTIQLNGGSMNANLTLNGSGDQTINGMGATSLAGLTVTNGNAIDFGGQTRTVAGNVTLNNASGTLTNGTLRMGGTSAQSIGGTGSGTITNLTIDNSAGVTLNRALTATGTLTMTSGNLNTTSTNLMTCASTSGGGPTSYVNGPLAIGGTGANYPKNYPVGDGGVYRPFQITTGPNAATVQRVRLVNSSPLAAGATPSSPLNAISAFRYWELTDAAGTAAGTQNGDQVILGYVFDPNDDGINTLTPYPLRVAARSAPLAGAFSEFSGTDVPSFLGVRGVQSNASLTSSLRFYTLGSVNTNDAPLPVELISFTGVSSRAGIVLNWATASERESAGFIIHRRILSAGQTEWQMLDDYTRNPALVSKNSTNGAQYAYTDRSDLPAGAIVEYRLDEVSLNGTIERLREVRVETRFSTIVSDFALEQNYPNPFNPTTNIPYQLKERSKVTLDIYNALGQKVATLVDAVQERGNHAPTFNASGLASGLYFYRLTAQGSRETFVQTKKMMLVK